MEIKMNEKELGGLVVGFIVALALAIIISRILFPIFLVLSIISFIILIIVVIIELRNNNFGKFSLYVGIGFLLFGVLTFITCLIGYGTGDIGEASLDIYYALTDAKKQVNQELMNSINQVVNESCETLDKENCDTLKKFAQITKDSQEIKNKAGKLRKLNTVTQKRK